MPLLSDDDFSIHDDDCDKRESGWMPVSDLPDEVTSIDDLDCACWDQYDPIAAI